MSYITPHIGGLSGLCWPWQHDLNCYGVASGGLKLTDALTTALKAGTIPKACASKALAMLSRAADANDWSVLSPGEYNWLNALFRALVHNDWDAPPECLMGSDHQSGFTPGKIWIPPPNDATPPGDIPWGWIIGGGVACSLAAVYWFYWRKKK